MLEPSQRIPIAVSPVGRRASREVWSARLDETCGAALERLRQKNVSPPSASLHFCYVVYERQRLAGYVSVLTVVAAPPDRMLAEVMNPRVIPIPEGAPEEAIQDFFITYGLLSFPVIDRDSTLVGVVGVEHFSDLVFEGFEGQVRDEAYRSIGLDAKEFERSSAWSSLRQRLPWLIVTLIGGFVAAIVLAQGSIEPTRLAAIAVFLPLCVMLAERTALHTLTIRAAWLAGERPRLAMATREIKVALSLAILFGTTTAGLAYLWQGHGLGALIAGGSVLVVIVVAAAIGLLFPVENSGSNRVVRVLHPVALAVADAAAVTIYVITARLILPLGQ
jgi:magnesium transporter